ncbi:MAG: FmdB family zinc ribbon protein [Bacteroidota bacterium]|jgi:putative FmdB family regulatory protein
MPTYIYKREDGTTFEIQQSINDDALEKCPETGQAVKRVITGGGGVVYKGDGFYVTDYKNNGNGNVNGNGTSSETSSAAESSSAN